MEDHMNAAEIIMETVDYYGKDPVNRRGIKRGTRIDPQTGEEIATKSCEYAVTNGETKYCAVGRCLTDEAKYWVIGITGEVSDLIESWWKYNNEGDPTYDMEDREEVYLDELLATEYQGQPRLFWDALQALHDTDSNWSNNPERPLTTTGRRSVGVMAREFLPDDKEQTTFMNEIAGRSEQ
jgi:hypothetical protein